MDYSKKLIASHRFQFNDVAFKQLMQNRVYKVLVICSNYDFFLIEEDGRIDELIFEEYTSLNLRYPPIFIHANSVQRAMAILSRGKIDLVITMLSAGTRESFEISNQIREEYPSIAGVVLEHMSREVSLRVENESKLNNEQVFSWLGQTEIFVAIIKLIEDRKNAEYDILKVGVQAILLVEDSVRFYSSYLPNIYRIILMQAKEFTTEAPNEYHKNLRMRGRPKILLATDYEEAVEIYEKYGKNILGVISDIGFPKKGVKDHEAGLKLCKHIRGIDKDLPFLLQSFHAANRKFADAMGVGFLDKTSKSLAYELRNYVKRYMAFGDFVFLDPDGFTEIDRASDLRMLQRKIRKVPNESFLHHFEQNDFSRWMNARALFQPAKLLREKNLSDFVTIEEAKQFTFDLIASFRTADSRGVISSFDRNTFDDYINFSRIGNGLVGGKARGLAYIDSFLKKHQPFTDYDNIVVSIPQTVVICTDIYDDFLETNKLHEIASSDAPDEVILQHFIDADFAESIKDDLRAYLNYAKKPVAVRSSSLLDDSHYQSFTEIYNTYMIPNQPNNREQMFEQLLSAIKSVYASVFFKQSKAYTESTSNVIDEEKMAVVLQAVCGNDYNGMYYPPISGLARSMNHYPIPPERTEDGIVHLSMGLGKSLSESVSTLRFSPKFPDKAIQLSSPKTTLRDTQKHFFALDTNPDAFQFSQNENVNIKRMSIREADKHSAMRFCASTYDYENNMIRSGVGYKGKKVITFANVLKNKRIPLSEVVRELLEIGLKELKKPVEIEFALNPDLGKDEPTVFKILQIRPTISQRSQVRIREKHMIPKESIIYSTSVLGNGKIEGITDVIYVRPQTFNPAKNPETTKIIERLNTQMIAENRNYLLIGMGRWGSSDPWLGIPVTWAQISAAKAIVESGLTDYRIDASRGTHFFQNLTTFRIGYFTINPYINDGFYDVDFLDAQPAIYQDQIVRHIRFTEAIRIEIDGRTNNGIIYKPN